MYLIQRKIAIKIGLQTLMVFAFVGAIVTTTQVLNQVFRLIDASSNLMVAVEMYLYLIPTITVSVLPIAFLIGCINVYDQLDDNRESVIVTGSGVHPIFTLIPAGMVALFLAALVATLSLFVEPAANRAVRDIINSLRFDALRILAGDGALKPVQPGLYIRGGGYDEAGDIDGLFILDRRNAVQEVTYFAERGEFVENEEGLFLYLNNGSIQYRNRDGSVGNTIRFETYIAEPESIFEDTSEPGYQPRQTSTSELQRMAREEDFGIFRAPAVRKELIRRYSDWLYPLVFFATVTFLVLFARFSRRSSRWRLPTAVLTGFVIKAVGLVILGGSGSSGIAAAGSFAVPVLAAGTMLALALLRSPATRTRRAPAGRARATEVPA